MADDPNEVLKDIAKMQGIGLEEELEQQQEGLTDGQTEERQEQEGQADETGEGREVLEGESEEAEDDSIENRYAKLLEQHNLLSAQILELQTRGYPVDREPPTPRVETPAPQPQVTPPPAVAPSFALDDSLLEKALVEDDPGALKQVLAGMVEYSKQLAQQVHDMAVESALRATPTVATNVARQQLTLMRAVEAFYTENQDLAPYQHIVGAVANEVSSRKSDASLAEVLKDTEVEVRRRLGLKKAAEKVAIDKKPAFAKTGASRKPGAPVLSGMRADIAKMQGVQ
jgi:hypothetical protein